VKKVFNDPATGLPQEFWGRVHFRGAQLRPNYFLVLFHDGDFQAATMAVVKKLLVAEDVQLPAGVSIPLLTADEVWNMMLRDETAPAVASAAVAGYGFLPAAISLQDCQLLFSSVDFSRVAHLSHPGCISQQLHTQMRQLGVSLRAAASAADASAAVLVSSQPETAMAAIAAAEQLRPAFLALYQPGFQLSTQLSAYLQRKQQQRQGVSRAGKGGIWFFIVFGPHKVHAWLRI